MYGESVDMHGVVLVRLVSTSFLLVTRMPTRRGRGSRSTVFGIEFFPAYSTKYMPCWCALSVWVYVLHTMSVFMYYLWIRLLYICVFVLYVYFCHICMHLPPMSVFAIHGFAMCACIIIVCLSYIDAPVGLCVSIYIPLYHSSSLLRSSLSLYLSIYLCVYASINLHFCLSMYFFPPSIHPSIFLSICLSISRLFYPCSVYPAIYSCSCLSTHPSFYPFLHFLSFYPWSVYPGIIHICTYAHMCILV
jgi:hypothetical protein